jgi:pentatricopeptide repeat protein
VTRQLLLRVLGDQTYAAAISACAHSGEWQRGMELLEGMLGSANAPPPNLLVFNAGASPPATASAT